MFYLPIGFVAEVAQFELNTGMNEIWEQIIPICSYVMITFSLDLLTFWTC